MLFDGRWHGKLSELLRIDAPADWKSLLELSWRYILSDEVLYKTYYPKFNRGPKKANDILHKGFLPKRLVWLQNPSNFNSFPRFKRRPTHKFNFEVSVDPESGSAEPGGSVAATVTVRLISGSPEIVALSVSGLPSGASVSLSQQSGLPTFTSTMVINTSPTTPTDTYTITVIGTGGGLSRSAAYTLTIYVYRSGTTTGIQGVTVKVDGSSYTTGPDGRVQVAVSYGSHTVEVVSPYSPSSGTRYVFAQWSDGSTSNPRSITVTGDATLTAYMKIQ